MIQGLYAAASGLMAIEEQQSVIANNIANASTPGFKRQNAIQEGFYEILLNRMINPAFLDVQKGPGGGLRTAETYSDFGNGVLATTGDPFHVALQGPGFFSVDTPDGILYTRNGRFTVDGEGQLATAEGHKVLSAGGAPIDVSGGRFEVDASGTVLIDGLNAGQISITEFEQPHLLSRRGDSLYYAPEAALAASAPAQNTRVAPGSLEMSNVQLPYEMAQMMLGLRAYGANQRVINCMDETMSRLIDQVAMPM